MNNLSLWISLGLSLVTIALLVMLWSRVRSGELSTDGISEELRAGRREAAEDARRLREEVLGSQKLASELLMTTLRDIGREQQAGLSGVERRVQALVASNEARLDKLSETIAAQLEEIRAANESKLEEMRQTVDEKLQSTLDRRLGDSFKLVSERLEAVQRGLGDMQTLAHGVGDLKRMLTNVKARGTWGEFQLGDILQQILTVDQFAHNVQPRPDSSRTVEYAIRLPGQSSDATVWLPIDSKFPQEDYQRLLDAAEKADSDGVERATAALVKAIQLSAKEISSRYVEPPYTTDFAIMFLPTEGLYSEVLRQPGVVERLQQEYRVVVAGPTTLSAILNSLRMGFRTLAIERRSSEVWTLLSAVKTEFGKFGAVLQRVKKQLDTASNSIDQTSVRTRAMERKLQGVEALPADSATNILGIEHPVDGESDNSIC
ncbi:MAG: DNA recombination protein RmuC [Mariprofundales bacterium]|nr:DNA recombination protein RmuC [Mariprofundales bacterium]